jgi:hypothetical protein
MGRQWPAADVQVVATELIVAEAGEWRSVSNGRAGAFFALKPLLVAADGG